MLSYTHKTENITFSSWRSTTQLLRSVAGKAALMVLLGVTGSCCKPLSHASRIPIGRARRRLPSDEEKIDVVSPEKMEDKPLEIRVMPKKGTLCAGHDIHKLMQIVEGIGGGEVRTHRIEIKQYVSDLEKKQKEELKKVKNTQKEELKNVKELTNNIQTGYFIKEIECFNDPKYKLTSFSQALQDAEQTGNPDTINEVLNFWTHGGKQFFYTAAITRRLVNPTYIETLEQRGSMEPMDYMMTIWWDLRLICRYCKKNNGKQIGNRIWLRKEDLKRFNRATDNNRVRNELHSKFDSYKKFIIEKYFKKSSCWSKEYALRTCFTSYSRLQDMKGEVIEVTSMLVEILEFFQAPATLVFLTAFHRELKIEEEEIESRIAKRGIPTIRTDAEKGQLQSIRCALGAIDRVNLMFRCEKSDAKKESESEF